jgi:hypothetical protein
MPDPPRFCLDETSFSLHAAQAPEIERLFENLIHLIRRCHEDEQRVARSVELDWVELMPGVPLSEVLYGDAGSSLDREVRQAMIEVINRCIMWDADQPEVPEAEVMISGARRTARSVAFAYVNVSMGHACACLCLIEDRSGVHDVTCRGRTLPIHFIYDAARQFPPFYREVPEIEDMDEARYMDHAALMFPQLYFVPGISQQFRRFTRPYRQIRMEITRHLGLLNDHFQRVFLSHKGEPGPTENEMSAHGIVLSPESPKTRQNKAAMRERKVMIDAHTLHCEWHCKLDPTENRIHFHPGRPGIAAGKVVIGIFAAHLPT